MRRRTAQVVATTWLAVFAVPWGASVAAEEPGCRVLCTPELKIEPTWSLDNPFGAPRVAGTDASGVERLPRETTFEIVFALEVPTRIPWLGLTLEAAFPPFENDNEVDLETELNFTLLTPERTGGWIDAHFDVIDQFSPAERPGEDDAYTHKLNLELDVALLLFKNLPDERYLRDVELELSFDYLATGLPKAGDVVDGRRLLDDASGWSISTLLVFPVAPWP